ncbi:MAG: sugar phosphate isomerase/epimerase [Clostridia bacterium]|nr:sugar phosphate isomerase/epimerase [Clostridia bacterium]
MELLCSTGTLVGRANGYDHTLIVKHHKEIEADGFELMFVSAFYDKMHEVARDLMRGDVGVRTIHFEKDITALLGLYGKEERKEGLRRFTKNVQLGEMLGADKAVYHLWDGRFSPEQIGRGIALLETLYEIADRHGMELLVENIPSRVPSPYENVETVAARYPDACFTFDTRHAHVMGQIETFFASPLWHDRISHLHVSDYTGETVPGLWGVTRPILHPGEGVIDFDALFDAMPPCVADTVTLESPVVAPDGSVDIPRLNRTLRYLTRKLFCEKSFS